MDLTKCLHGNGPECERCKAMDIPEVEEMEAEITSLRASLASAEERAAKAENGEQVWKCAAEMRCRDLDAASADRDDLAATVAGLRGTIETLLKSAVPHPVEHPTMTAAWKIGTAALNAQPHESLTRFVARVQEDALKAAVESLKGERRKRGEELEKAEHELEESLKDCVAVLTRRSGRGFDPEVRWGDIIQQTIECSYKALAAIQAARAAK